MPIFDSQYPVNSNPAGEDKILTTDTSDSSAVKSVTLTKVQEWLGSISKWVVNSMIADGAVNTLQIADGAVTADKIGVTKKVITITLNNTTGNQTITGVGFKPRQIRTESLATSDNVAFFANGYAIDDGGSISQDCSAIRISGSNLRTGNAGSLNAFYHVSDGGTGVVRGIVTSFNSDGFVVNVDSTTAAAGPRTWTVYCDAI